MLIKGEAYEFVKKYVFTPSEPVKPISTFAEPKGVQTIIVKYIVRVPSIPPEVLNTLSKYMDVEHYIAYYIFSCISNKTLWKYPAEGAFETEDQTTALWLAEMVRYYTGGCWIIRSKDKYYIWTRGYYHYVGA
jgi:hypothetical protein